MMQNKQLKMLNNKGKYELYTINKSITSNSYNHNNLLTMS